MLRWAVLGTGFISNTVVEAIGTSDGSEVVAVAGRNVERLDAFRATHGIERSFVGYDEVTSDPDVDVVYIGLPNHMHHELAIAAASAGKAILSEKSLTTSMETAHALVDGVCDKAFFVEGLMYLAHPLYRTWSEMMSSGRYGVVQAISARYAADIAAVVNPLGRGTIYNLGCYPVSLTQLTMQLAFGDEAFADRRLAGVGTRTQDDTIGHAALSMEFGNGVVASIQSTDNFGMAHDFVVMTTAGELRFETNPWLPGTHNTIVWQPYGGPVEEIVVADGHDAFHHQVKMVELCVLAGRTEATRPSPRLADSLQIMEVLTEWERLCLG